MQSVSPIGRGFRAPARGRRGPAVAGAGTDPDSGTPDRFDQTFKQRDNPLAPL